MLRFALGRMFEGTQVDERRNIVSRELHDQALVINPKAVALRYTLRRFKSFGQDFGQDPRIHAVADAHATTGLSHRVHLGKARKIETVEPWTQDKLERQEFELHKIDGEQDPSDALTKPVQQEALQRRFGAWGCQVVAADDRPSGGGRWALRA